MSKASFKKRFSEIRYTKGGGGVKRVFHINVHISNENADIYTIFALKCNINPYKSSLGIFNICLKFFVNELSFQVIII